MADEQTLEVETIVGMRMIKAPAGWVFDKTATIVWHRLLQDRRVLDATVMNEPTQRRKISELEARVNALAQVLASALGMAAFYWEQKAKEMNDVR